MIRILYAFILILFFSSAFGQNYTKLLNPKACQKAILETQKSCKSLSADFEETIHSAMFSSPQKKEGKLLFKKEQKIRWEHISDKKQVILMNGNSTRMSENGKEIKNAGSKKAIQKIQQLMLQLLNGEFLNEKEFTITYFENSSFYKLILKPKNSRIASYISEIELIFDKKNTLLQEISLVEDEMEKMVYAFKNIQLNPSISDSKFEKF